MLKNYVSILTEKLYEMIIHTAPEDWKLQKELLGNDLTMAIAAVHTKINQDQFQQTINQIDLGNLDPDESVLKLVPAEVARKYGLVPIDLVPVVAKDKERETKVIVVLMTNPDDKWAKDDIKFTTGYSVKAMKVDEVTMRQFLKRFYSV